MTLFRRMVTHIVVIALAAGGLICWTATKATHRTLVAQTAEAAVGLAGELTPRLAAAAGGGERALLPLLQSLQSRAGADRAYVTDGAGRIVADTNVAAVGTTPPDATARAAAAASRPDAREAVVRDHAVLDLAIALHRAGGDFLLEGGTPTDESRVGTLRLILPLDRMRATERSLSGWIALIVGLAALLTILVGLELTRRIVQPVTALVRATERIAAGTYGISIPEGRQDELGNLTRHFNQMSDSLFRSEAERSTLAVKLRQAERLEAVGLLAGKIAHDFNSYLAIITLNVDFLLRKLGSHSPLARVVEETGTAVDTAKDMTGQLKSFARGQILALSNLDLNELIRREEGLLRTLVAERAVITLALSPEPVVARTDPAQMSQVLLNLVKNARDAIPADRRGTIAITTGFVQIDEAFTRSHPAAWPGRHVELRIRDDGAGMDDHTLRRMFEPFFTTKAKGEGTGLGLASVHGIVRQSSGYIWAESEPGRGSEFHVLLPRLDASPDRLKRPDAMPLTPGRGETILLVEDVAGLRTSVRRELEGAGYRVQDASNAPDAVRIAAAGPGDLHLLLTDVVMPGMSGFDLAAKISADRPGTRILLMSGYAYGTTIAKTAGQVGHGFIEKPFTGAALLAKVREVLDAR